MNLHHKEIGVFSKKQKMIIAAIIIITFISMIAMALIEHGNKIAANQIDSYLSELSYQTSYKVNQRVDMNLDTLLRLSDELSIIADSEKEQFIANTLLHSAFEEIGYINVQGILAGNQRQIDISNTNIMSDFKNGKTKSVSSQLVTTAVMVKRESFMQ